MNRLNEVVPVQLLSRVRRNHALEHATLQVLAEKFPGRRYAGYSTFNGYWVIGQVDLEELQRAVNEAQTRLRSGERRLAVHPNCGTNFAFSGLVAGIAAWLAMLGAGKSLRRRLTGCAGNQPVTLVLILTYPLGARIRSASPRINLGDCARCRSTARTRRHALQRVQTRDIAKTA